jgi:hypothetical protein
MRNISFLLSKLPTPPAIVRLIKLTVVAVLISIISSCEGNDMNKKLYPYVKDGEVDASEFAELTTYLEQNKSKRRQFLTGDSLDIDKLTAYIKQYASGLRPPIVDLRIVPTSEQKSPLSLLFYLERSGSMEGYDAKTGSGEFKSAIVDLLNHFPTGQGHNNLVFVVNDGVYNYPGNYKDFIQNTNIFATTRGIGNPQWTDFSAIFDSVLVHSKKQQLNVLVSDLIYSPKNIVGLNPQKIFNEAKGLTSNVFMPYVKKGIGTLVIKMRASYDGKYYPYNSPNSGRPYNGERPYYFVVVGDNESMARIFSEPDYQAFSRFNQLNGFKNLYCFMPDASSMLQHYSIVLGSMENAGTFRPQQGANPAGRIIAIENIKPDRDTGDFRVAIALDLSGVIAEESYKLNPANYQIESADEFNVVSITPLTQVVKNSVSQNGRKYLEHATHLLLLQASSVTQNQKVKVSLLNRMPEWISASSSDDDRDLQSQGFNSTTFALQYLMQGIYDAYYSTNIPTYAKFELSIHK